MPALMAFSGGGGMERFPTRKSSRNIIAVVILKGSLLVIPYSIQCSDAKFKFCPLLLETGPLLTC